MPVMMDIPQQSFPDFVALMKQAQADFGQGYMQNQGVVNSEQLKEELNFLAR